MTALSLPSPLSWHFRSRNGQHVMALGGNWIAQAGDIPPFTTSSLVQVAKGQTVSFDTANLGTWDSGLIEFLWDFKRVAHAADVSLDSAALPDSARQLLALLPSDLQVARASDPRRVNPVEWLGGKAMGIVCELGVLVELSATMVVDGLGAVIGRTRMRRQDLLTNLQQAGPSALVIVSVVNLLLGAILAFVGAAELRRFAAGTYVADLVGVALVRELGSVVTAIVMAGRTGGAYAARLATMQGNEEIDALRVIGIPISSYLLLPSVLALLFTMPLLYLYGCVVGIFGGFIVSYSMLDVTAAGYFQETLQAVPLNQFVFGFLKSIAFAVLVGICSCRIGLKAGRSSADVGIAATQAVVTGIVGIIALDALFAVIANAIDI